MRTIRVDLTDEDYATLKTHVHFGQISFILRKAIHEYLMQLKVRDAPVKEDQYEMGIRPSKMDKSRK